jgi:hypothetical protein
VRLVRLNGEAGCAADMAQFTADIRRVDPKRKLSARE